MTATYFDGTFDTAVATATLSQVHLSSAKASAHESITDVTDFSVRFEGFLRAESAGIRTFYATVAESADRVRLFVGGDPVLDGWSSGAASATVVSSTFSFGQGTGKDSLFEHIRFEYASAGGPGTSWGTSLGWEYEASNGKVVSRHIISPLSYVTVNHINESPFGVFVETGPPTSSSLTLLSSSGLSLATAGEPFTFTISATDKFGDAVNVSKWTVAAVATTRSLSIPAEEVTVTDSSAQLSATLTSAGVYDLSVWFLTSKLLSDFFSVRLPLIPFYVLATYVKLRTILR